MQLQSTVPPARASRHRVAGARASLLESSKPDVLTKIVEPGLNLTVWRRRLPEAVAGGLGAAARHLNVDRVLRTGAVGQLEPFVEWLPTELREWMRADLEHLVSKFAAASGASAFRASLQYVDTDACRKFHADYIRLRMLCTYRGPGTLWLDDAHADRSAFDWDNDDHDAVNDKIVRDPAQVGHARPGDVVMLKGHTWPGNEGHGAVHRSPRIEVGGESRLVFKVSLR